MLRFLSRRNRNHQNINNANSSDIKSHRIPTNKNLIQCRVILLDNSDISIELSVSAGHYINHNWIMGEVAMPTIDEKKVSSRTKEYKKLEKLSCLSFTYNHWDFIYSFFFAALRCCLHVLRDFILCCGRRPYIKEQQKTEWTWNTMKCKKWEKEYIGETFFLKRVRRSFKRNFPKVRSAIHLIISVFVSVCSFVWDTEISAPRLLRFSRNGRLWGEGVQTLRIFRIGP